MPGEGHRKLPTGKVTGFLVLSLASALAFSGITAQSASALDLAENDRGAYKSDGFHDPNDTSYLVGDCSGCDEQRNFFVFDLGNTANADAAVLRLFNPAGGFATDGASETYVLYEVSTSISSLVDGTGGTAAWDDLGEGTQFADPNSYTATAADNNSFVEIDLNETALAALNAASGLFAIGGAITTLSGDPNAEEKLFFGTGLGSSTTLVLTLSPSCGDGTCDPGEDNPNNFCGEDCGCENSSCAPGEAAPSGCFCGTDCVSNGNCCSDSCQICGDPSCPNICGNDLAEPNAGEECDGAQVGACSSGNCNAKDHPAECQCVQEREQNKDQQACINELNKAFALVAKTQGKAILKCVGNVSKGKVEGTIATCIDAGDNKVNLAKDKTLAKAIGRCLEQNDPNEPTVPDFGATDPNKVNEVAIEMEIKLAENIFGDDLDAAIRDSFGVDKAQAKCQLAALRLANKCLDTRLKGFVKCAKGGLKGSSDPNGRGFGQVADLRDCIDSDPKEKIKKACGKALSTKLKKKCDGIDIPALFPFPGKCASESTLEGLKTCLDLLIECRVCKGLGEVDQLSLECDGICDGPIGSHPCIGDPNTSQLVVRGSFGTLPPLPFGTTAGEFGTIECDLVDANGVAPCRCMFGASQVISLGEFGSICLEDGDHICDEGEVHCETSTAVGWELTANHNLGDNCSANSVCEEQCAVECAVLDAEFEKSGCEGFCEGGANAGEDCAQDTECPGGACNGKDNGVHGNICSCQCLSMGGLQRPPGGLNCRVPLLLTVVEPNMPCFGPEAILSEEICIPLTTGIATNERNNIDNFTGFNLAPLFLGGENETCDDLRDGNFIGRLVGHINVFDFDIPGLGENDVAVEVSIRCE